MKPVAFTVWLNTSVSKLPKFRYCSGPIGHTVSDSSSAGAAAVVGDGGCVMQSSKRLPGLHNPEMNGSVLSVADGVGPGAPKVELAGLPQSTWNSQISTRSLPPKMAPSIGRAYGFGVPGAGGGPVRSPGSRMTVGVPR